MIAEVGMMALGMTQGRAVPVATDIRIHLEVLAWRAGLHGNAQVAARLFGAVEGMSGMTATWEPLIGAEYDRSRSAVRSDLGDRRFEESWWEGRRLSPEQALAYASGMSERGSDGEKIGRVLPDQRPARHRGLCQTKPEG
jgi:hypothetical protein